MVTAFFPGKFQPPHVGHFVTVGKIYDKYDKIIIGITEDVPKECDFSMDQKERKRIFDEVFRHMPKVEVVMIKGIIETSEKGENLPKFDICLTGNEKVIKKIRSFGMKAEFLPRSEGPAFSGEEIRRALK